MAFVLIIEDDHRIARILARLAESQGHETQMESTLGSGVKAALDGDFDLVMLDLELPDGNGLLALPKLREANSAPEVLIVTGTGNSKGAELAFEHGAWDYVAKPFLPEEVLLPLTRALQYRAEKALSTPAKKVKRLGIIGNSAGMRNCLRKVSQAATSDASVLITGETGVGKELFARAVHENSARAKENFVVLDCAAIPSNLVESMLFGHEKGAFTGADHKSEGLINKAHKGTLFLDEVGELPLSLQKSFLRVLQEHCFRPLGSTFEEHSDFRVIAATNQNLDKLVAENKFRKDLLFRLRSFSLELPPLRKRSEDIKELLVYHLKRLCTHYQRPLPGYSPEFLDDLLTYDWPGNVREFLNVLENALAFLGQDPTLYRKHLPVRLRMQSVRKTLEPVTPVELETENTEDLPCWRDFRNRAMDEVEANYLKILMTQTKGTVKDACKKAGLSESRLHALLKKHKVNRI